MPENLLGQDGDQLRRRERLRAFGFGFITLPLGTSRRAHGGSAARGAMVTNDPCGVTAATASGIRSVTNQGKGSFSVSRRRSTRGATTGGFVNPGTQT